MSSTRNRIIAVAAMLAVFGGIVAVTQVSAAGTRERDRVQRTRATACPNGDRQRCPAPAPVSSSAAPSADDNNGLDILGDTCDASEREPHDGFQNGDRCVSTQFGEVGNEDDNPTLVIVSAPQRVRANRPFTLKVSTRNLVRDRFLAAGQGGYYLESSFLNDEGLTRGHFHTACRMLTDRNDAPEPGPVPDFFVATEDGQGGAEPDTVTIEIPGLPTAGLAQCAAWAGDGSHRIPMMQRANQIPAFDIIRMVVTK